jgi:hypothetical protein
MQPSAHQLMLLALVSGGFALLGALLGTVIAGLFSLRAKRNEYVNDYYKKVIDRRIAAYEQLESLIVPLKSTVASEDKRPYHFLFRQDEASGVTPILLILHGITSQALWLSDEAFQKTRDFERLLWSFDGSTSAALIEFGKQNYQAVATLRDDLERILAADMLGLHDVGRFLSRKKTRPDPGFQPWP